MAEASGLLEARDLPPAAVLNRGGSSDVVLVCEHASNHIPESLEGLGLDAEAMLSHAAWDPGAAPLARGLSRRLDAALVELRISRLVIDCNRSPDVPTAIPAMSERFVIPGNRDLSHDARQARIDAVYRPAHRLIGEVITERRSAGPPPVLVTIHTFTPVFMGHRRDVEIGILHDADARLADHLLEVLAEDDGLVCRRNQPYGPADGVTHMLRQHALPHGLANVMVEVRNDLVATAVQQEAMAERLAPLVLAAIHRLSQAS